MIRLLLGLVTLAAFLYLVITRIGEEREFAQILLKAEPLWILAALAAQGATYFSVARSWLSAFSFSGFETKSWVLARLSLEKVFLDQAFPSAGLVSNVAITKAFRRFGATPSQATTTMIVGVLGYYAGFAAASILTVLFLWLHKDLKPWITGLLTLFTAVMIVMPSLVLVIVYHQGREGRLTDLLRKIPGGKNLLNILASVSKDTVLNKTVVPRSAFWSFMEFVLDAVTLYFMFLAIGHGVPFPTAFAAYVVGAITQTVGPIPGGIGTFEAACVGTLSLLGVRVEPALTATLLLRGFTLWLPLLPGFLWVKRDTLVKSEAT